MDVLEAIKARRSVRAFQGSPVPDRSLANILEAGRLSPSSLNGQRRRYVVVSDPATRSALARACGGQKFVAEAPVVVVVCSDEAVDQRLDSNGMYRWAVDTAIASSYMTLAAVNEGLGTCWVGSFDEGAVREALGVPPVIRVCCLLPVGVPAADTPPTRRMEFDKVVFRERWEATSKKGESA